MSMLNKVMDARKDALRNKDKIMPRVLNMVINTAREKAGVVGSVEAEVTDTHVVDAIRKCMNDNKDLISNHEKRKETEKVDAFEAINVKLEDLLPKAYTKDELTIIIKAMETKSMGVIMPALKKEHTGKYDPKMASEIARSL